MCCRLERRGVCRRQQLSGCQDQPCLPNVVFDVVSLERRERQCDDERERERERERGREGEREGERERGAIGRECQNHTQLA